jgi:hypothetical protein
VDVEVVAFGLEKGRAHTQGSRARRRADAMRVES